MDADAVPMPNPKEVAAVQWLTFEELLCHPDLLESNRSFLEELQSPQGHYDD
jgi:isopentenyldiphosphate isomerase